MWGGPSSIVGHEGEEQNCLMTGVRQFPPSKYLLLFVLSRFPSVPNTLGDFVVVQSPEGGVEGLIEFFDSPYLYPLVT